MTPEELQAKLQALREADRQWRVPPRVEAAVRMAAAREVVRPQPGSRRQLSRALTLAAAVAFAVGSAVALHVRGGPEHPAAVQTTTHRAIAGRGAVFTSSEMLVHPFADEAPVGRVRVRLPRSALAAFGVAAADPLAVGFVEADVDLGPDGNAQRIRFFADSALQRR